VGRGGCGGGMLLLLLLLLLYHSGRGFGRAVKEGKLFEWARGGEGKLDTGKERKGEGISGGGSTKLPLFMGGGEGRFIGKRPEAVLEAQ